MMYYNKTNIDTSSFLQLEKPYEKKFFMFGFAVATILFLIIVYYNP